MDVINIPFNQTIGVKYSDKEGFVYMLHYDKSLTNHLGSFHAAVLFHLAEASSGEFLTRTFPQYAPVTVPLLRTSSGKYKKPTMKNIHARCRLRDNNEAAFSNDLDTKGRGVIGVVVDIFDDDDVHVFTGEYDWFVSKLP